MRVLCVAAVLLLNACSAFPKGTVPPYVPLAEPHPDSVESVLFLIGDAGLSRETFAPLIIHLQRDVEWWSGRLGRDSAVAVLYLGDNVYPRGVHAPEDPEFPRDSAQMDDQVAVVSGPAAMRHKSVAWFIPGNHDWAQSTTERGLRQLRFQEDLLERMRARGPRVALLPHAGNGGPHVVDVGRHLRVLMLDTAWWLLEISDEAKQKVISGVEDAMRTRGGREIVIAAHHPLKSGSSHGGLVPIWQTLGIEYLLYRSGAMLQDLNSIPYKSFNRGLRGVFARVGSPLLFAGGHDHSLQVLQATDPTDPRFMVVSGSGSKSSPVEWRPGMLFKEADPGYMRLVTYRNGAMQLFVTAAPKDMVDCTAADVTLRQQCSTAALAGFRAYYSLQLRGPGVRSAAR